MADTHNPQAAQIQSLAEKKLTLMSQIHELRAEIRKLDVQLVQHGTANSAVQHVLAAW